VGNNQSHTAWIDEGLAEYSTVVFFGRHPEYNLDRAQMISNARQNYSAYIRLIREIPDAKLDTSMERDLNAFNTSYEYVYMTYVRGLLLFCDLEKLITEETLLRALSDFHHTTRFNIASREKLVASLESTTGAPFRVFFETYILGWEGIFGQR
jgi:predicted metalloprotease with PDZ domain